MISCDLLVLNTESEWSWIKIDTIFYSNYIFRRSYNFWITRFWLYIYYYFLFFALVEFKFLGIVGIIGFVFLILNLIWGAVRFVRCDFEFFFFIFFLGQNSWIPLTLCVCGHLWIKIDYFIWLLEKNLCSILLSFFFGWIFKCLNLL